VHEIYLYHYSADLFVPLRGHHGWSCGFEMNVRKVSSEMGVH